MITLTERPVNGLLEMGHICTFCSETYVFYNISPRRCLICEKPFPNMVGLVDSKNYRIKYHIFKENVND